MKQSTYYLVTNFMIPFITKGISGFRALNYTRIYYCFSGGDGKDRAMREKLRLLGVLTNSGAMHFLLAPLRPFHSSIHHPYALVHKTEESVGFEDKATCTLTDIKPKSSNTFISGKNSIDIAHTCLYNSLFSPQNTLGSRIRWEFTCPEGLWPKVAGPWSLYKA